MLTNFSQYCDSLLFESEVSEFLKELLGMTWGS